MKKILILAYDFPPYVSVAGLRPYSWYKYLHQYDIHPVVVTRQWKNKHGNALDYISPGYSNSIDIQKTFRGTVIKTPYIPNLSNRIHLKYGKNKLSSIRRFITAYYEFLQYILPIGNKKEIYYAADEIIKNEKIDCIIATGEPFVLFKYAAQLSKKHSIPWIADYRDPWIQNVSLKDKFYKNWFAYFERVYLKTASKITTVSTFIKKQIEQNIEDKEFGIIYNGYDPEIVNEIKNITQSKNTLSIAFTGTIYKWHPIESILQTCNELIAQSDIKLELFFYGTNEENLIKEKILAKYTNLNKCVFFHSKMENLKLAKSLAKHNVFLLFNDYSILGTKIFDYLAVNRKILLCYDDDKVSKQLKDTYYLYEELEDESNRLQADVIEETNSGIVIKDSEHLKQVLIELNNELREKGIIECNSVNIDKYSRVYQVEKLVEKIKHAISTHSN